MSEKLLLWLSGDVLHFCLAYYLQKDFDFKINAIVDVPNKPKEFFQKQKLVEFNNVWYFHDHIKNLNQKPDLDYLKYFESKYEINLHKLAINERIFYLYNDFYKFSSNEVLKILEQECKLFETIIEESKMDYFLTPLTGFHHHHLFYEICRKKNIKILMLYMSKYGHRCVISEEVNKLDFCPKLSDFQSKKRNFQELLNYFRSFDIVKQIEDYKKVQTSSKFKRLKAANDFFMNMNYNNNQTHYTYYGRNKSKVLLNEIKKSTQLRKRKIFIKNNLSMKIPEKEKFVYYPLHIEQERNLLIAAPFFTNQIELIRNIAKSLPIDYKLVVKEHPAQETREWRKISEYKEIMDIPDVTLIHPSISSRDILEKCSLVITIGGTIGLEAAFYEKPSIILNEMDYSMLPSVEFVQDVHELHDKIKNSLKKIISSDDLDKFMQLYEKNSFEFDYIGFISKYQTKFYYNGNLLNAEIEENDMKKFLDDNQNILKHLTDEHIKKIDRFHEISDNEKK